MVRKDIKYPGLVGELAKRNISQKTLANIIGVGTTAMSFKMTGKNDFTISEVEKICEYFNKNYYELFK